MFHLYFSESIPNITDWIQAGSAVLIFLLTALMACYAKRALNTWKDEEKHRTEIELMKFLKGSRNLIIDLRNRYSGTVSTPDKEKIEEYDGQFQHLLERSLKLKTKLETKESEIERVGMTTILAISQLDESNPLRIYYQYIDDLIDQIRISAKSYHFLVESMDSARNDFVESGKKIEKLKNTDDLSFKGSDLYHQYGTISEAKEQIEQEHKLKKESWEIILDNVNRTENTIFRRMVSGNKNDGIHDTIMLRYEAAKKYCEHYSNPKRKL